MNVKNKIFIYIIIMALMNMSQLVKKYGKQPEKQKEGLSKEILEIKRLLTIVDKKCGEKLTRKNKNKDKKK